MSEPERADYQICGGRDVILYHVTTVKKAARYRETGYIKGPVRGFDTLLAAMAWAIKTGRKIIYRVITNKQVHPMPDHHNKYGMACWTDCVPIQNIKCEFSASESIENSGVDRQLAGGAK